MLGGAAEGARDARARAARKNPQRAKERQIYVLNQLVEIGKLNRRRRRSGSTRRSRSSRTPSPSLGIAPEWVELVRKELVDDRTSCARTCPIARAPRSTRSARGPHHARPELQAHAQRALQAGLRGVDERQHLGRPLRTLKARQDRARARAARASGCRRAARKASELYDAIVTAVHDADNEVEVDLGDWKAALVLGGDDDARFNPPDDDGKHQEAERAVQARRRRRGHASAAPAAAATGDDEAPPKATAAQARQASRDVPAPARGRGRDHRRQDAQGARARRRLRVEDRRAQPRDAGACASRAARSSRSCTRRRSTRGKFTAASIVNDAPEVFDLWKPKNYESGKFEGPVLLRYALAKSINTVAIRVTYDVKPATIAALAHKMGIHERAADGAVARARLRRGHAARDDERVRDVRRRRPSRKPPRFIEAIDGKATPAATGRAGAAPRGRVRRHRHDAVGGDRGHRHPSPPRSRSRSPARPARRTTRATPGSSASRPTTRSACGSATTSRQPMGRRDRRHDRGAGVRRHHEGDEPAGASRSRGRRTSSRRRSTRRPGCSRPRARRRAPR